MDLDGLTTSALTFRYDTNALTVSDVAFGSDGSVGMDAVRARYEAELANEFGNLASRTLTMINRYFKGEVPYPSHTASKTPADDAIAETARKTIREFGTLFDQFQFSRALEAAWGLVAAVDKYIVENEPWAIAEKPEEAGRLDSVLFHASEALRVISVLLAPVMPQTAESIWHQLGFEGRARDSKLDGLDWGHEVAGKPLCQGQPLPPTLRAPFVIRFRGSRTVVSSRQ